LTCGQGRATQSGVMGRLKRTVDAKTGIWVAGAAVLLAAGVLTVRAATVADARVERARVLVRDGGAGYSDAELTALMAGAGQGALLIAAEHDPDAPVKDGARPGGWERLEVRAPPNLGLVGLSMDDARKVNGAMAESQTVDPAAQPFVLHASRAERAEALKCMTAAIYYEAALEPRAGQEAVAQVVLNRLRHQGYPKSVCGVVFQGADRPGCQFSFACDGSMARPPAEWAWKNAADVAEHALDGYVMKAVGMATHYHTNWVTAWWTPTMLKVRQIGAHIFFRPIGAEGQPEAFSAAYLGGETDSSRTDLIGRPEAAMAAAPLMFKVSAKGSVLAPRGAVQGGRMIVLPSGTIVFGSALRTSAAGGGPAVPPMHAMIALRAAAARAKVLPERPVEAAAPEPAFVPRPEAPAPKTVATKGGFQALEPEPAPAS
jgi:spore germination cell wall hydrolase CwlJ-like protein